MSQTDNNSNKPSILKHTREARGLTLEIVHEATKIPMDALKAIEEGYSVRILTPFYFRGFVKIYAEFLGLNTAEVFKEYGIDQPAKATSSASLAAAKIKTVREPAVPNPVIEQLQEWGSFIFKPKNLMMLLKVLVFLALIFLLVKIGGCVASHFHKKQTRTVLTQVYSPIESKPVQVPPVVRHQEVTAPSQNDQVEVAVRAMRDTWLQVKTDGHVVYQMTLSKGSMESWSADDRIELSGRDIEHLDMEVNGKHIGSLGEHRIRRVLITSEGLTVKK